MQVKHLFFILLLSGCSSTYKTIDVPYFEHERVEIKTLNSSVNVVFLNHVELEEIVSNQYALSGRYELIKSKAEDQGKRGLIGATKIPTQEDKTCTIYTLKPEFSDDYEEMFTLGHEFLHCLAGHYHN